MNPGMMMAANPTEPWNSPPSVADVDRITALTVDPTPDSVAETSASDWSILPERVHFIVDMFRCFQEQPDLLTPPFTPDQVAVLKDGRKPHGRL